MNDPYKVLGVLPSATDEELKQAYRELIKKYHPDNYAGSPLADLAGEKMSEINAAYDVIVKQRKNGANRGGASQGQGYGYGAQQRYYQQSQSEFADVRRLIAMGRILESEEILDGVLPEKRTPEWYFLKGSCLYNRGFVEDAFNFFKTAAEREPQNHEYRSAVEMLLRQRQYGYGTQVNSGYFCTPCGICSTLLCADCTCSMCRCCC